MENSPESSRFVEVFTTYNHADIAVIKSLLDDNSIVYYVNNEHSNFDSDTTEQIYDLLREINQRFKTTFIIITHDRHIAEKADRIVEILDGKINLDITK